MIVAEGGNFNVMKQGYVQCQECGSVHLEKMAFDIEELYVQIKCPRCRGVTKHIWVGDDPEDVYYAGDITLDERYYNYNTK